MNLEKLCYIDSVILDDQSHVDEYKSNLEPLLEIYAKRSLQAL